MFVLTSEFTIGRYRFRGCNSAEFTKSVWEYQCTGIIKIPTSAAVRHKGIRTASVQTAQTFKAGDHVLIKLGYDSKLREEFKGFVSRVNVKTPCEIEIEGYSYLLRTKKNIKASWRRTTLKEVLLEVVKDTAITLHPDIPDVPLNNIKIDNATGIQAIDYLKGLLAGVLTVCFTGDGSVLYAGLAYMDLTKTKVKHRLGWNTINNDNLKVHRADEVQVNVQLQFKQGSGQQVTVEVGQKGGIVKKETISAVTDMKVLREIANAKLKREQYDGYEGDYTTFLIPYVEPSYACELSDNRFPERGGKYFAESVKTSFGQSGARRVIQIGTKL